MQATGRFPGRVCVAVETRRGRIAIKGWRETLATTLDEALLRLHGLPLGGVLATCIDVEGQLAGPDVPTLRHIVETTGLPVIASGGVRNVQDVAAVRDAGCAALVVGTALYTGGLDLAKAQEVARDGADAIDA